MWQVAKELRELGYDKDYEGLLPEDFAHLTEEERQLLGGDATRSHLVKGLDMVLLEKVGIYYFPDWQRRREIAEEEEKKRKAEERMNEMKLNIRSFTTPMAMNIHHFLFESKEELQNVNVLKSPLVDIFIFSETREAFLKGKTNYTLTVSGDVDTILFSVPATTIRSKHDCPDFGSTMVFHPSEVLIASVTQSMAHAGLAQSKTRKRKNRHEIKAVDAEVDMFSDCPVSSNKHINLHL